MSDHLAQTPPATAFSAAYTYVLADFQALRRAKRALSPVDQVLWRWRYVLVLGISFAVLLSIFWDTELALEDLLSWSFLSKMLPLVLLLISLLVLVDIVFDWILMPWVFRRLAIANKSLVMAFDHDGIVWSTEGLKGELAWSKVTRIITLKGYVFLFISKLEALCIPRRAFTSEAAFSSLVTYAKERVNG
jgi:YcxB-like protein